MGNGAAVIDGGFNAGLPRVAENFSATLINAV
jgi:hypothetical protein